MPSPPPRDDVHGLSSWRRRLHDVIFEADTRAGKLFDVALLIVIVLSVLVAMLESVASVRAEHHDLLVTAEWVFTGLFTIEYGLRLLCVRRKLGYAFSFFGIVDFLAILPTYLQLLDLGWRHAAMVRSLRLLRIFRVFKLAQFLSEASELRRALAASRPKIVVFFTAVVIIICIVGSAMYLIEGKDSGFTSIPQGIYWAVVTVTTVGYGDISPVTPAGKMLAAVVMLMGYSILIIPGGIISAEWVTRKQGAISTQSCPDCSREGHDADADYCKFCGGRL
jgi:voltage-gated potassium channel